MMLINPYRFAGPPPVGIADDFNRADGHPGSNWTRWDDQIVIEGNKLKANVLDGLVWNTAVTANHWSKGTVSNSGTHSTSSRFGVAVRMSADGGSYYVASIRPSDGRYTIDRVDAGTQISQLATATGVAWVNDKVIELRATTNGAGVDLVMKVNDATVITTNDAVALTGTRVGIGSAAGGNNGFVDDWSGGSI